MRHIALLLALAGLAPGQETSRFADGSGPAVAGDLHRLLDAKGTRNQSNAIAFERAKKGAFETTRFSCKLRVLEGGDGGAIVFLNTREYGVRGAAPYVKSWVEPNLRNSFAVGIDVHNPKNEEMFGEWGNYLGRPEREVSLHWDGREIAKRMAPAEFRGDWADCNITVQHVVGGAEVTVQVGPEKVYDRYFVAGMLPYESRLAIGAGTRADAATEFDVEKPVFEQTTPAKRRRAPKHFEVFNHVLTDNSKTSFESTIDLPPANWEFGRIILTLQIHDAGPNWDEWDRNGHLYVYDGEKKWDIVPFITSYRTECFWQVDVTHFRPWLSGKRKFEIAAGTTFYKNRGYMMSVSLDYYHGKPDKVAYRVEPVWVGTAKYKSAENHFQDFFDEKKIEIDETVEGARLCTTTTGHSQIGEFVPSKRAILVNDHRFENLLWKDDCYLNPNRPQFGTWKFARAGWAPGDVVRPWWIDLTGKVSPGTAVFRYEPHSYEFPEGQAPKQKQINQASHVIRSFLILYRTPKEMMPAPSLQITNVEGNAKKAGVKRGDYLAYYDGKPIHTVDDLRAAIGAAAKDDRKIPVVVFRGTKRLELELDPGKMGVNLSAR
ncbi:MAG: peptide-N-glycosidase F-related protein [Planctomycetota bacterium]|jgi:hypothetical protein